MSWIKPARAAFALALLLAASLAGGQPLAARTTPAPPALIDFAPREFATTRGLPGQLLAIDRTNNLLVSSADGGKTWWRVPTPEWPGAGFYSAIALAPRPHAQPVRWLFAGTAAQPTIHRSGDFGQSWAADTSPRFMLPENIQYDFFFSDLQPSPADPTRIYAVHQESYTVCEKGDNICWTQAEANLHTSADGGVTWAEVGPRREWISELLPSPILPLRAYIAQDPGPGGTWGWLRTDDGGQTWTAVNVPVTPLLALDATDPNRLYTATQRSDDGGQTWTAYSGYPEPCSNRGVLSAHPTRSGTIFYQCYGTTTRRGRAHLSRDGGETWQEIGRNIIIDQSHPSRLYWIEYGVLYESFDEGDTWLETPILFEPGQTYLPALSR